MNQTDGYEWDDKPGMAIELGIAARGDVKAGRSRHNPRKVRTLLPAAREDSGLGVRAKNCAPANPGNFPSRPP